jgi:hypothetical protein
MMTAPQLRNLQNPSSSSFYHRNPSGTFRICCSLLHVWILLLQALTNINRMRLCKASSNSTSSKPPHRLSHKHAPQPNWHPAKQRFVSV